LPVNTVSNPISLKLLAMPLVGFIYLFIYILVRDLTVLMHLGLK